MAIPVNDRDLFLRNAASRDVDPRASKYILLTPTTPIFRVTKEGVGYPSTIDITAMLFNLPSSLNVTFSVGSGGTLTGTGLTRTLAFSGMTTDSVTITASVTESGQTYIQSTTIQKVSDGQSGEGSTGTPGNTVITAFLFKWSTVNPGLPTGTATCTTASGKNTSYSGTDGYYVDVPENTFQPGLSLYVAQKTISVPYGVVTTAVTYSAGATVAAYAANGSNGGKGDTGLPGIKNTLVRAYQWSNGPAPTISGTAVYTWATASYTTVPNGWSKTKPDAPALGYTLYEATVGIVDSTGAATTGVDFGTSAVVGISYMATNGIGTKGDIGATGRSVAIAYTLVTGNTLAGTPATITVGGTGMPAVGAWGSTNAWTPQPSVPAAGQSVFQTNGIYDGVNTVFGLPYLSSLRVGSLSTLTANLGAITAGSIDLGSGVNSWHVDTSGNQWIGSGTFNTAPFRVNNAGDVTMNSVTIVDRATGNTILNAGGLKSGYEAPGTKNADIVVAGRNIIQDSAFEGRIYPWTTKSAAVGVAYFEGTVGSKNLLIDGTGDAYVNADGVAVNVTTGVTYNFSCDYSSTVSGTGQTLNGSFLMYLSDGSVTAFNLPHTGNVRVRFSTNWTCPAGVTAFSFRFGFYSSAYGIQRVYNFKMAVGNKDTGWSAAPEDSVVGISSAQAAANAAKALADSAPLVSNLNTNSWPTSKGEYSAGVSGIAADKWALIYDSPSQWTPHNRGVVYVTGYGVQPAGAIIDLYDQANDNAKRIDVIPGEKYEFSVALSQHRCAASLRAVFYKADGTYVGESANVYAPAAAEGARFQDYPTGNFPRTFLFSNAPTDASKVMVVVRLAADGRSDPYVFASEWYVGRASQTQTIPTPYTDFSATGLAASTKAAMDMLAIIADDGKLSRGEKPAVIKEWNAIDAERQGIVNQAAASGVSSANYQTNFTSLSNYLIGIDYGNVNSDSTITPSVFSSAFVGYYAEKQALLNAIAAKAQAAATAAQSTADTAAVVAASGTVNLVSRGYASVVGNNAAKLPTGGAWDSDVYSKEGYIGGAMAQATIGASGKEVMFGLNRDPLTNGSYDTIDFSWYMGEGGNLRIYNLFNGPGDLGVVFGTYVAGDVMAVMYDGSKVYFLKNGAILKTIEANLGTDPIYFDSSFQSQGAMLNNIKFVPLSSNAAGVAAQAALPGLSSSLADKLSKSANSTLTGTIALATQYAIQVGNANDGIFIGSTGLYGRKGGATQLAIMADGTALFNGTLGAGVVKAGNIEAGAVTAGNIAAGAITASRLAIGNADNVVPDSNMLDSAWWNRPAGAFTDVGAGSFWKSSRVLTIGVAAGYVDSYTTVFPVERGAQYLFQFQSYITDDFAGQCAVYAHLPGQDWFKMGAEWRGYTFANANPAWPANQVMFDENSAKSALNHSGIATINNDVNAGYMQFRIITNVQRGSIQFGGFRVTRMTNSILLADGAVTADKLNVGRVNGQGAGVEIDKNGGRVYGASNNLLVRWGVW